MKKPNLFIIGAMKSGTTSLHHYISQHPQVFMSEPKEPGYLKQDKKNQESEDWYYSLFNEANNSHLYVGEGSTDYAKIPQYTGVADRIKAISPDAKIVYVMRNPYQRTISHYWHTIRPQPADGQTKNLYDAVKSFEGYLSFSDYAMQIQPYIDTFGKNNIHFILFEELTSNPKLELEKLFDFLGVSHTFDWNVITDRLNSKPQKIVGATGFGIMHRLSYSKAWSILSKCIPKSFKNRLKNVAIKEVDPSKEENNALKVLNENRDFYLKVVNDVSQMINRDLSNIWKI